MSNNFLSPLSSKGKAPSRVEGKGILVGLSPMDGITDEAFRLTQCHTAKPDLIFTEFVSAEGLAHGATKLFDQLLYSPIERPIIGQLFGKDPDSFYKASIILCALGFDGIDINMGCPAKTVTQHGSGASLIGKPPLASEIIKSVRQAINDFVSQKVKINQIGLKDKVLDLIDHQHVKPDHPPTLSVKTRLGITTSIVDQWIPFLLQHRLDFLTLHGRTLKQGYSGLADWSQIKQAVDIAADFSISIIGNGDIHSRQQGIEYCQKYGTAGVLIGRASLGNPWAFNNSHPTPQQRFDAALYHFQVFQQIFPHRRTDSLRRHLLAYTSGLANAKQLRSRLVKVNTINDFLRLEKDFVA